MDGQAFSRGCASASAARASRPTTTAATTPRWWRARRCSTLLRLLPRRRRARASTCSMDLTAVDYLDVPGPRGRAALRGRLSPLLGRAQPPRAAQGAGGAGRRGACPPPSGLWPIANWLEREVWDMFGIRFDGHPDLRRLLLYEEFVGPPAAQGLPDRAAPAAHRVEAAEGLSRSATDNARTSARRGAVPRRGAERGGGSQHLYVNLGPAHPAMHGIIRIFAELDGEMVGQGRRRDRLPAPRLREGLRGRPVQQRHPVHRPPQLRLAAHQQLRLRLGGREAPRHRRSPSAASTSA